LFSVPYVIFSHTHSASIHSLRGGKATYLNEGTWAPAFYDVECTKPIEYRQSFVWIHDGTAAMYQWRDTQWVKRSQQVEGEFQHTHSRKE
jgi:UDP-2,3-diacylglucosamine pyrophosphatase LpxH